MSLFLEDDTLVRAIATTLLHSLWQGALFAALLAALLRAMRRASANARYLVACGAMTLLVTSALVTFALASQRAHPSGTPRVSGPATLLDFPVAPLSIVAAAAERHRPTAAAQNIDPLRYLVMAWLAGIVAMAIWHVGGWLLVLRMRRGRVVESMRPIVSRLAERMNVRRVAEVIESAAAQVPAVIGVFRPVIVVPVAMLSELSPQQVEAILAHELAHVRRHDYLVNLLQCAAETLMFYHPATWWISAQVRCERENCADDLAARACGDGRTYAAALAAVESMSMPAQAARQPHLAPAATHGNLLDRVRRILRLPPRPRPFNPARSLAAALLTLACVIVPLACAAQQEKPATTPQADLVTAAEPAAPASPASPATAPSALRITPDPDGGDKQFLEVHIAMSGLHHANRFMDIATLHDLVGAMPQTDRQRTVLVVKADAPDVTVDHYFRHEAALHRLVEQQHLAYLSQAGIAESTTPALPTTAPATGAKAARIERAVKELEAAQARVESLERALAAAHGDPEAQYDQLLQQQQRYRRMMMSLQGRLGSEHPLMKSASQQMEAVDRKMAEYRTKATLSAAEKLAANEALLREDLATLAKMEMNLARLGQDMGRKSRVYLAAERNIELQRELINQHVDAVRARQRAAAATRPATTSDAWNSLGASLASQGRLAEGEAAFARAASLAPDRQDIAGNLARVRAALAGEPK